MDFFGRHPFSISQLSQALRLKAGDQLPAKLVGLLATTMLFLCNTAAGTETRVNTLQGIGGIQDETDIYTYPGVMTRYQLALVELGTSGNNEVYGGAFAKADSLHIGGVVSRDDWMFSDSQMGSISLFDRYQSAVTGSETNNPALMKSPERPFELFLAMPAATGALGIRLAYAAASDSTKKEETGVESTAKSEASQVQMGIGYTTGTLDLGLTLDPTTKQSRKNTAGGTTTSHEVKGKTVAALHGRWLKSLESSGPYATGRIMTRSYSVKSSSAGADESSTFDDRIISAEGGWVAMSSSKSAHLFTGIIVTNAQSKGPTVSGVGEKTVVSYLTSDKKADIKTTVTGAALAGEADIAGGFGAMMGLHYILFGSIKETDDTTGKDITYEKTFDQTSDASLWSLGVYYRQDALRVDASYGKEFLHNGPYLISGAATKPLLARISARYAF